MGVLVDSSSQKYLIIVENAIQFLLSTVYMNYCCWSVLILKHTVFTPKRRK